MSHDGHDTLFVALFAGKDTLLFMPDDSVTFAKLVRKRPASWVNRYWWPSTKGTLAVKADSLAMPGTDIDIQAAVDRMTVMRQMYSDQLDDIAYYNRSHSLQDEGFDIVMRREQQVLHMCDSIDRLIAVAQRMLKGKPTVTAKVRYSHATQELTPLMTTDDGRYLLLRCKEKPDGIRPVYLWADSIGRGALTAEPLPMPQDTVIIGHRDSLGLYTGNVIRLCRDGSYYEGGCKDGAADGFGVSFDSRVRAGVWKNGTYCGEQPYYSSNHVYGIDISRYQHEKGKKKFGIDWGKLRITSLGTISKKRVNGVVDYPISFIYIKCTQGRSIQNKYYRADYAQSRSHGYRTGSYHFFQPNIQCTTQASWFLRNVRYSKGDLPPVLDVEPTHAQVMKMGGPNAMLWAVRQWMEIVEQRLHVRPILYVSQTFVNRYMTGDNYLKKNYKVWIARYGEYKPDVRLVFWQLCPDGRVRGIHTPVDINIFNGFPDSFRQF